MPLAPTFQGASIEDNPTNEGLTSYPWAKGGEDRRDFGYAKSRPIHFR
jgi:hypothetical protein